MNDDINNLLNRIRTARRPVRPVSTVPRTPAPEPALPIEESQEEQPEENTIPTVELEDDDFSDILESNGIYLEEAEQEEEQEEGEQVESTHTTTAEENVRSLIDRGYISADTADRVMEVLAHDSEDEEEESEEEEGVQEQPEVPLNSPTLTVDDSSSRFSGTLWYNEIQRKEVIIAGLGGIGSWLAALISRMKPQKMVLYDDDVVEMANMSGQLYGNCDVGTPKVDAVYRILLSLNPFTYNVFANRMRVDMTTTPGDIMMCGFDNMEARNLYFHLWSSYVATKTPEEQAKCLYLDGRLSINTLQVFCIRGNDEYYKQKYHDEYLFSDADAEETVCSMKQTTYLACMIASVMANLFVNFTANLLDPIIPYDLPFFTEYDAENMIFKTEK